MGLDMYLSKTTYLSTYGNRPEITIAGPGLNHIKPERVDEIKETVGYWRKANQIHSWFVTNVQNGVDDCGTYEVSTEQLQDLLDAVNTVLEDHDLAGSLLRPGAGFFFGGTEYDEYYFSDLEGTKGILEALFSEAVQPEPVFVAVEKTDEPDEALKVLADAFGEGNVVVIDPAK